MKLLEYYLKEVQGISDMQKFLEKYKRVVTIRDPVQQYVGLTVFNEIQDDIAFIFEFDT